MKSFDILPFHGTFCNPEKLNFFPEKSWDNKKSGKSKSLVGCKKCLVLSVFR